MKEFIDYLIIVSTFILQNFWEGLLMIMVLWNIFGINKTLKGKNGVWQLHEISVTACLLIVIFMVAHNASLGEPFSDVVLVLMLFVLIVLAKTEKAIELFLQWTGRGKKDEDS